MNTALQVINVELSCIFLSGICLVPLVIITAAMHVTVKKNVWFNMVAWGALAIAIFAFTCAAVLN